MEGIWQLIDRTGTALLSLPEGYEPTTSPWLDDCYAFHRWDDTKLLTRDGQLLELPSASYAGFSHLFNGWVSWPEGDGTWTLYLDGTRFSSLVDPSELSWPWVLEDGFKTAPRLYNLETGELRVVGEPDESVWFTADLLNGTPWLTVSMDDGYALRDLSGTTVATVTYPSYSIDVYNGFIARTHDNCFTLTSPTGETVFSFPIPDSDA